MADPTDDETHGWVGTWARDYYAAVVAVLESVLRPYDLGRTQWYVLNHLAIDGPTLQRDLRITLRIEGATLSGIVATLVRKNLIDQVPASGDQRQRLLRITDAGMRLWEQLPDPLAIIREICSSGSDADELATAHRVLRDATLRLHDHLAGRSW